MSGVSPQLLAMNAGDASMPLWAELFGAGQEVPPSIEVSRRTSRSQSTHKASTHVSRIGEIGGIEGVVLSGVGAHFQRGSGIRGYSHRRSFTMVERGTGQRYLFPIERNIASSLQSIQSFCPTLHNKLLIIGLSSLAVLGVRQFGYPVSIFTNRLLPLEDWIAGHFRSPDIRLALSSGTPGAYQKTTIQVLSQGQVVAFAKCAKLPPAMESVRNEARVLRILASNTAIKNNIPAIIGIHDGIHQVLLLVSSGPLTQGPNEFTDYHLQHLRFLNEVDAGLSSYSHLAFQPAMRLRLSALKDSITTSTVELLKAFDRRVEQQLSGAEFRGHICHGDFVPWNTRLNSDGSLFVFDWEFAKMNWLPMQDAFHFLSMPALLDEAKGNGLWTRFNLKWRQIAYQLSIPSQWVWPLFCAYLLDVSTFYLHARKLDSARGNDRVAERLLAEISLSLQVAATSR